MEEKNVNEEQKKDGFEVAKESNKKKKKTGKIGIVIACIIGIILGAALVVGLEMTGIIKLGNNSKENLENNQKNSLRNIASDKVVAKTNSREITEKAIYSELLSYYTIDNLLDKIDRQLLDEKYSLTEQQEKDVDSQMKQVFEMYNLYYGLTEKQFLEENGFKDKEAFRDYLVLDYKRNLQYLSYIETLVSEDEIKKYYDEEIYGEINTKHMLVQVTDKVTEKEAKKMAEEIIKKLNDGKDFDKVAKEYGDKIIFEKLGYNGFDSGLVKEYVEASKELKDGKYSKEPVKTEYGYHVIYRIDQKEKKSLEEVKNVILVALSADLEAKDENLRYKAFIKFREENGMEINDEKLKKAYEELCEKYNK